MVEILVDITDKGKFIQMFVAGTDVVAPPDASRLGDYALI